MDEVTREKLASDFKALIDDVEELLKTTGSQTGEGVADLRQRLEKKLEEGRKALDEQQKALLEKAREARASTEAYLRENPWTTLGIAAGIGLVLGLLLRRD
jgi:ElaB/YqjD/DUF883 family membrane-anchored ribosome-binding protein